MARPRARAACTDAGHRGARVVRVGCRARIVAGGLCVRPKPRPVTGRGGGRPVPAPRDVPPQPAEHVHRVLTQPMLDAVFRRAASWPTCSGPGPDRVRGRPLVSFTVEWPPNSTTTPSSASNGAPPTPRSSGHSASSPSNAPTSTRTRRRRALQGDQRGVPGAVRPGPPPALRHVRPGEVGGPGEGDFGFGSGFGGFSDIFDAFFGGATATSARRGRPQTGSDLRYDLRITFEEAITGTEKEIDFRVLDTCRRRAAAAAPRPGTSPTTCRNATGAAGYAPSARRCSARWSTCRRARAAGARGASSRTVATPARARAASSASAPRSHHPGGHRRRPPDPPVRRRRGRAARRRAGQPVRGRPRQPAPDVEAGRRRAVLRGVRVDRPGRARDDAHRADRRGGRGGRGEGRHQPGTEIRLRGRGVRTCAGTACAAISTSWSTSPLSRLSKKERELLAAYAEEAGEAVASGGGFIGKVLGKKPKGS